MTATAADTNTRHVPTHDLSRALTWISETQTTTVSLVSSFPFRDSRSPCLHNLFLPCDTHHLRCCHFKWKLAGSPFCSPISVPPVRPPGFWVFLFRVAPLVLTVSRSWMVLMRGAYEVTVSFARLYVLYEDDMCLCILDVNPLSHGHSLIIPKVHFSSLDATHPSVVAAMCSKVPFISSAIMKATGSDSFNLLVNNGAAAGQVIFHTHIHIIPRKAHDCLWTSKSLHRRQLKVDREALGLANRIQELLSNIPEGSKGQESGLS